MKNEKLSLCNEIASLRRKITILEEELDPFLELSYYQLKSSLLEVKQKIHLLNEEHRNIRIAFDIYSHLNKDNRIDNFDSYLNMKSSHNNSSINSRTDGSNHSDGGSDVIGYGWQIEAFLSIAGKAFIIE
jgi:hypothetical protein